MKSVFWILWKVLHGDMTILVIAHRLSTIRNADRIYLMDEGHIVESGTWDELLSRDSGSFKRVWKAQATEKIRSTVIQKQDKKYIINFRVEVFLFILSVV